MLNIHGAREIYKYQKNLKEREKCIFVHVAVACMEGAKRAVILC
jgi:hypothetical protein